jgi:hypothetical protein
MTVAATRARWPERRNPAPTREALTTSAPRVVDHVLPVCVGTGETVARVIVRGDGALPELVVAVDWAGITVYVPCRRVNRITDPQRYYIAADGTLYQSAALEVPPPVWAEVWTP